MMDMAKWQEMRLLELGRASSIHTTQWLLCLPRHRARSLATVLKPQREHDLLPGPLRNYEGFFPIEIPELAEMYLPVTSVSNQCHSQGNSTAAKWVVVKEGVLYERKQMRLS